MDFKNGGTHMTPFEEMAKETMKHIFESNVEKGREIFVQNSVIELFADKLRQVAREQIEEDAKIAESWNRIIAMTKEDVMTMDEWQPVRDRVKKEIAEAIRKRKEEIK